MYEIYKPIILNLILSLLIGFGTLIYKLIFKKKVNLFFLLILISFLPIISIARPGTYESGDLTLHSVFLQSFYENLKDGLLIPQWAGGLCAGFGCPVFLFEYVSPFYIGSFFHFLGFSYIDSMKLFLATSFVVSGITMYLFLHDEYDSTPSFVGSLLYLFAPIHLIEMHYRVSVGTHAAFMFVPLAFLFAKKSLTGNICYIILNAITFLLLIISHSSVAFVTIPISLLYAYLKKTKNKQLLYIITSICLGIGLSAYYLIPAIFELQYTWYSQTIRVAIDFKPFLQYIYSPARFGLLFQGNNGELRLIVGYVQLFIIFCAIYISFKQKNNKDRNVLIFLLIIILLYFTLMLEFTKPLWKEIFFLRSFILPWRLLVPISFFIGILGTIVVRSWQKKWIILFCILTIGTTILNWGNRHMIPEDKNAYQTHWSLYTEYFAPNNSLYLKRWNERNSSIPQIILQRSKTHAELLSGKGDIKEIERNQIRHTYITRAETNLLISENTYYFPGWKIFIDNKEVPINIQNNYRFGTLVFSIPKGLHVVSAEFNDTAVRRFGKIISLTTLGLICILAIYINPRRQIVTKNNSKFHSKKSSKVTNKKYKSKKRT